MKIEILVASKVHYQFSDIICQTIFESAIVRGTGIAKRTPEYIRKKIDEQKAVIALVDNRFAGFCYIECWQNGAYVVHSGLIVHPEFRNLGLARKIKTFIFNYSLKKYPKAKIFGITTGLAVMKINSELGYRPVPFSELTTDPEFWSGCQTCTNYPILLSKDRKMCLCTGMLYDPNEKSNPISKQKISWLMVIFKRLSKIKQSWIKKTSLNRFETFLKN